VEVVRSIDIEPEEVEILRLLGRAADPGKARQWTVNLVREAVEEARSLVEPQGVYGFFDRDDVPGHVVFDSAERVGLCVCTIGPRLEGRVYELMSSGELAKGVVLDAVGSEAAEAAARWMDERMAGEESPGGLRPSGRFSPGYGQWTLEGQRLIFDLLDAGPIGVHLSRSMMMTPRKSVSFAMNFGSDPIPPRCETPCERCTQEDCIYRREQGNAAR